MTPEEEQSSKDRFIESVLRAEKLQKEVDRLWKEKLRYTEDDLIQMKEEAQFLKRAAIVMWTIAVLVIFFCLDWSSCS